LDKRSNPEIPGAIFGETLGCTLYHYVLADPGRIDVRDAVGIERNNVNARRGTWMDDVSPVIG
jgi:hypothetical protein